MKHKNEKLMYSAVTRDNVSAFTHLLTEDIAEKITAKKLNCIGGIRNDDELYCPQGTLCYEVVSRMGDGEKPFCYLTWLYVDPEHRGKGTARGMLSQLFEILKKNSVKLVVADFDEEQAPLLRRFYEDQGFSLDYWISDNLSTSLEEIKSHLKGEEDDSACKALSESKRKLYGDWYDPEISTEMTLQDGSSACLLIHRAPSGDLCVERIDSKRKITESEYRKLLKSSMEVASEFCPKKAMVEFCVESEESAELVVCCLPENVMQEHIRAIKLLAPYAGAFLNPDVSPESKRIEKREHLSFTFTRLNGAADALTQEGFDPLLHFGSETKEPYLILRRDIPEISPKLFVIPDPESTEEYILALSADFPVKKKENFEKIYDNYRKENDLLFAQYDESQRTATAYAMIPGGRETSNATLGEFVRSCFTEMDKFAELGGM
jgi:GNAT superfamily N-acetyltransferase